LLNSRIFSPYTMEERDSLLTIKNSLDREFNKILEEFEMRKLSLEIQRLRKLEEIEELNQIEKYKMNEKKEKNQVKRKFGFLNFFRTLIPFSPEEISL